MRLEIDSPQPGRSLGRNGRGEPPEAIVSWLADAVGASDSLSTRITDIATVLTTYASILLSVKTEAECVRSDATAGGRVVGGGGQVALWSVER